jgi:hypothetical protein
MRPQCRKDREIRERLFITTNCRMQSLRFNVQAPANSNLVLRVIPRERIDIRQIPTFNRFRLPRDFDFYRPCVGAFKAASKRTLVRYYYELT